MEEAFEQTVVAKHFQGAHLAGSSQSHAVMLLVFHKRRLLRGELLKHSGNGSGADTEMLRQGAAGYLFLIGGSEFQDGFQVVVRGLCTVGSVRSRYH
jgi:hypothetical protein